MDAPVRPLVISTRGLSKAYRIGVRPHLSLRDALAEAARAPLHHFRGERAERGRFWALQDISLEVRQGEVLGLIGRNGAGKSTLLRLLSRITPPTRGRADVYGRVASLLEVGTGFHPELTGRENIFLNGAILGMPRREIAGKFDQIVSFAEIEQFIDTPVKRYSSGMYLRLAFAVAAHLEQEILLVDEVLAVGDAAFQRKCLGKMGDVASSGRTVLFVSHNLAAVQGLCTRCCLLNGGRLVMDGRPHEVVSAYLTDPEYLPVSRLDERADRQGSGAVRFLDLTLQDASGRPIDQALSGQDVRLLLTYASRERRPLSRLDVHLGFYTALGQFMFTCSSDASGHLEGELPAEGRLSCRIPDLPLAPGRYMLNLYATVGGEVADWVQQACWLDVAAGDYFGTGRLRTHPEGFLVRHRWEVETPAPVS